MPPRLSHQLSNETLLDSWGRRNRKLLNRKCPVCGVEFRPTKSTSRFCSRPCLWSQNGGHNRKQESWWTNLRGYIEGRIWEGARQRRVKAHRYVVELHIGRRLQPDEDVHHKNGIKTDNRLCNLEVLSHGEHTSLHNIGRKYRRGYRLNLSAVERQNRADRMRAIRSRAAAPNNS